MDPKKPNTILLWLIIFFVFLEITFLQPSKTVIDEEDPQGMFSSIETLIQSQQVKDEVGYTMDGFHYTAVTGENKSWELIAKQAILYDKTRMVLAQDSKIRMFETNGKVTNIDGDTARYNMGSRDIELEGNVRVLFPDGFWLRTKKANYLSIEQKFFSNESFYGESTQHKDELLRVWGTGFAATKSGPDIHMLNNTHAQLRRYSNDEITDVRSNQARIDRATKVAYFFMHLPQDFVESDQGTLHVRGKRQQATYDSNKSVVKFLTAEEDVLIQETDEKKLEEGMKYATCQKADFLTQEDKIFLSGFPAAYQKNDRVTGDLITVYRKKNLIEVTQANAYHEGSQE